MPAILIYYIKEALLSGSAGNRNWNISAVSGGGAGSTVNRPDASANDPNAQGLTTDYGRRHRHGGPIPAGRYRIGTPYRHPHLGLAARLDPYDATQVRAMMGRSGFYIHGRGRHGSDGCIVPMTQFQEVMASLTRERGGVLYVMQEMWWLRWLPR